MLRLEARPNELMKAMGSSLQDDNMGFNGQSNLPANHPLTEARTARFETDRAARKQVEILLTLEQRNSIPNEVRGLAQFESFGVWGL